MKLNPGHLLFGLACSLLFSAGLVRAEVRLPGILSDHAVLQKSPKTSIWGWAEPGEEIKIQLDKVSANTRTGTDGRWKTQLDLSQSGPGPFELVVEGKNRLTVTDVLVGDLWLTSGQSNMQFTLNSTTGGFEEIVRSANPSLRWFNAAWKLEFLGEQQDVAGKWLVAGPHTSGDASGVAYYFGKKIQADLKIPVGLIFTAVGGTTIQSWMSDRSLDSDPALRKERDLGLAAFQKLRESPAPPKKKLKPALIPAFFYNQLIEPLSPMTLRGFLWYQGEAHFNQGDFYAKAFPALIRDWRQAFAQGDLPFYFCQLPNTDVKTFDPGDEGWIAGVREAQDQTLKEPETGQVILIDAGEADLHPGNKKIVGDRLAMMAEARAYGQRIVAEGPRYLSCTREGNRIKVTFSGIEGGLLAGPLSAAAIAKLPESKVQGFAVCGADKKWVWARAEIQGDHVEVWSPEIAQPLALRYAWANNPTCNLFNKEGFPAAPFRVSCP